MSANNLFGMACVALGAYFLLQPTLAGNKDISATQTSVGAINLGDPVEGQQGSLSASTRDTRNVTLQPPAGRLHNKAAPMKTSRPEFNLQDGDNSLVSANVDPAEYARTLRKTTELH